MSEETLTTGFRKARRWNVYRESPARRRSHRIALLFVAPAALMVTVFLLVPVVFSLLLSFTRWQRFTGMDQFAGFANYQKLFSVPYFSEALINTSFWVLAGLIPIPFGLGLALLLRRLPGQEVFKSLFFIPRILAPTAVGTIWYYMYSPHGVINSVLSAATGESVSIGWLFSLKTIIPAIVITGIWGALGITMVLMLLGLATIPKDPIEAARVDGASSWQAFRYVIWPQLLPTVTIVAILNVIGGFTTFDVLWVMAKNYPERRSLSLAVYMYYETFSKGNWAYGAAIAVILSIIVLVVTRTLMAVHSRIEDRVR